MASSYYKEVVEKVAEYCAQAERSPRQVREKLGQYGLDSIEQDKALQSLRLENFINEERFAKAYCHDKFEFNKWGRIKLRLALQQHNVTNEAIEKGLNYLDVTAYKEMVAHLLKDKWENIKPQESVWAKKQKVAEFVIRKGFERELVFTTLDTILSSDLPKD